MASTHVFTHRSGCIALSIAALCITQSAGADELAFGPHDVRSVFYVAKSENENQVHYAIRLDPACRPLPNRPVWAYWKRVKEGRRWDAPLSRPAERVYGVDDDQRVHTSESGGVVQIAVRALDHLRIEIRVRKTDQRCEAVASTTISGQRARLSHAFLKLRPPLPRPRYVEVIGFRSDGRRVSQRYQ